MHKPKRRSAAMSRTFARPLALGMELLESRTVLAAEIEVRGGGQVIGDGDTSPLVADGTDFGSVDVATGSVTRSFFVRNAATAGTTSKLGIVGVALSGPNTDSFQIVAAGLPARLSEGAQITFQITANPNSIGIKVATVVIDNSDADENPYTFTVQVVGAQGGPEIEIRGTNGATIEDDDTTPSGTDGTKFENVAARAHVRRTFEIRNQGTEELRLTGSPLVKVIGHTSAFAIVRQPPTRIAARSTASFDLDFSPSRVGTYSAVLEIRSNDLTGGEDVYSFQVTGTGEASGFDVTYGAGVVVEDEQTTVDLGTALVGATPTPVDFKVLNAGVTTIRVSDSGGNGEPDVPAWVNVTSQLPATLLSRASKTFTLRLNTSVAGNFGPNEVTIATDDPSVGVFKFFVTGSVVTPDLKLELRSPRGTILPPDPSAYDMGAFVVGQTTERDLTFTITNRGQTNAALSNLEAPAGVTIQLPFSQSTLAPDASATFTIRVNTATERVIDGQLVFQTGASDPEDALFSVRLTGSVRPPLAVDDGTAPSVTLISPNLGGTFHVGQTLEIEGSAIDKSGISHVEIILYEGEVKDANRVGYIYQGVPGSGAISRYSWLIPEFLNGSRLDGEQYKLRWVAYDNTSALRRGSDIANRYITIKPAVTATANNGFDYPIGLPNADGWTNIQGFRINNHLGEDWNKLGGRDADLGQPVYAMASGQVTYAGDGGASWNGVVMIRHADGVFQLPGGGTTTEVEAQYAHLDKSQLKVKVGDYVHRGQQLGVVGPTPSGSKGPHLHLEIRRIMGLGLGPGYRANSNGWIDPTEFIELNRPGGSVAKPTVSIVTPTDRDYEVGDTLPIQGTVSNAGLVSHVWIELYLGGTLDEHRKGYIYQGAVGSGVPAPLAWNIPDSLRTHRLNGDDYRIKWVVFYTGSAFSPAGAFTDGKITIRPTNTLMPDVFIDAAPSVNESAAGSSQLLFKVRLSRPADQVVSIKYSTADHTATAGLDYHTNAGSLYFNVGETQKMVSVSLINDADQEDVTETVYAMLTESTGAVVVTDIASGEILDNDEPLNDDDNDGLWDEWEENGYITVVDGVTKKVDLAAMGARKDQKDIFVEIDYMAGMEPDIAALKKVVDAFWNAPERIALHIDYAGMSMHPGSNNIWWDGDDGRWSDSGSAELVYKKVLGNAEDDQAYRSISNIAKERFPIFHYCLYADYTTDSIVTGRAPGFGTDFLIFLGPIRSIFTSDVVQEAATFMHELGHTLGLGHGGRNPDGTFNHDNMKPNYISVMNYFFNNEGLSRNGIDGIIDYSHSQLNSLNEEHLNEFNGIADDGLHSGFETFFTRPETFSERLIYNHLFAAGITLDPVTIGEPIDWDNDGTLESEVEANINNVPTEPKDDLTLSMLRGHDDWGVHDDDGNGLPDGDGIVLRRGRIGLRGDIPESALLFEPETVSVISDPLNVIAVTTVQDGGPGSLRQALLDANASVGRDIIAFNILDESSLIIRLDSPLPQITSSVMISATTQPTYIDRPVVEIDGSFAGLGSGFVVSVSDVVIAGLSIHGFPGDGIVVSGPAATNVTIAANFIGLDSSGALRPNGGAGVRVVGGASGNFIGTNGDGVGDDIERNVIAGNAGFGVVIEGAGTVGNIVAGNYVGTDTLGVVAMPNALGGLWITGGAQGNVVGTNGDAANDLAERNIIAGQSTVGVRIEGAGTSGNRIAGNYIGTDISGTVVLPNLIGVEILNGASGNIIGTNGDGLADQREGNLISGNTNAGVLLSGAVGNVVAGNLIGVSADGTSALGNGYGVQMVAGSAGNRIGSNFDAISDVRERNVISGNQFDGVRIVGVGSENNLVAGNFIGLNNTGLNAVGNGGAGIAIESGVGTRIEANNIFANGGLGIDLGADGVTANDALDADGGANLRQNFPALTYAVSDANGTLIAGSFSGAANATLQLEFFASDAADASGFGEGRRYLGSTEITTNASGAATFTKAFSTATPPGEFITATARDAAGNTSEFSASMSVNSAPLVQGVVWDDSNGDGVRQIGEPFRGGVRVYLVDSAGSRVTSSLTNSQGEYQFQAGLGTPFRAELETPSGAALTLADLGGDDLVDSDFNAATAISPAVTFSGGGQIARFDAGLLPGVSPTMFASAAGGPGTDSGNGLAVDETGASYVVGRFQNTVDFDPGPGNVSRTSAGQNDVFVAKYSAAGSLVWVRQFGGGDHDIGFGIAVDAAHNVFATGFFGNNIFVLKLDAAGNEVWTRTMGGPDADNGYDVAVAADGSVYVGGEFKGTANFGGGIFLTSSGGDGIYNAFLMKLNAAGDTVWVRQMGAGDTGEIGDSVAVTHAGDIVIAGHFTGAIAFAGGSTVFDSAGVSDIFVAKYDSAGNLLWARRAGGGGYDAPSNVAVDSQDNLYVSGSFEQTADFNDPGPGAPLVSNGGGDAFLWKLNSAGSHQWVVGAGGTGADIGTAVAIDSVGNPVVTGEYRETVDFNPAAGEQIVTSAGDSDVFLWNVTATGEFVGLKTFGGTNEESASDLALDASDNMTVVGSFRGVTDLEPGLGTTLRTATGDNDFYLTKIASGLGVVNGFAWTDADEDGVQDAGELGLPNVTVRLLNAADVVLDTTVTNASGAYRFNRVPLGAYRVEVMRSVGYAFSPQQIAFGTAGRTDIDFGGLFDVVQETAVQPDGKILVIGASAATDVHGGDVSVARLNADGTLDPTFGTNGKVLIDFGSGSDEGSAIELQPDGKIVIAGSFGSWDAFTMNFAVARLTSAGALDPTFSGDGKVITAVTPLRDRATGIVIQPDGKIVVSGYANNDSPTSEVAVVRYLPDGTLDATFGSGGIVRSVGIGRTVTLGDVLLQADGKIVVGAFEEYGAGYHFVVFRYQTNGQLDPAFGDAGAARTTFAASIAESGWGDIVLQSDGKIVLSGIARLIGENDNRLALTRFTTAGQLDTSFGNQGLVTHDIIQAQTDLVVQSDGRIVTVAANEAGGYAVRFLTDGSVDPTFGVNGRVLTGIGHSNFTSDPALGLRADDSFVVVGTVANATKDFAIKSYSSDGHLQNSAAAATLNSDVSSTTGRSAMFLLASGSAAVTLDAGLIPPGGVHGVVWNDSDGDGIRDAGEPGLADVVVRLLDENNAVIDTEMSDAAGSYSFANVTASDYSLEFVRPDGFRFSPQDQGADGGALAFDFQGGDDIVWRTLRQSDGKIVTAGRATAGGNPAWGVLRVHADGTPDTTFGVNGRLLLTAFPGGREVTDLLQQPDGKLLLVGYASPGMVVARLNLDGSYDTSFNGGFFQTLFLVDTPAVGLQSDGKIVIAGGSGNGSGGNAFFAMRLTAAGVLDTTFGASGKTYVDFGPHGDGAHSVKVLADDSLLLFGRSINGALDADFRVAKLTSNGELDTAFGSGGSAVQHFGVIANNSGDDIYDAAIDAQGRIVAVGIATSNSFGTAADAAVVRWLPSGALDPSFGSGGMLRITPGVTDYATDVDILPDGRILVTGQGGDTGSEDVMLTMLLESGALDISYGVNGIARRLTPGFNGTQTETVLLSDGTAIVAATTRHATNKDFSLVRFTPQGQAAASFGPFDENDSDVSSDNGRTNLFAVAAGTTTGFIDVGLVPARRISGGVWRDADGDGVREIGELPEAGVTVRLLDGADQLVASTVTLSDGTYLFDDLAAGAYRAEFVLSAAVRFSLADQGDDDSVDSDANPIDGRSTLFDAVTIGASAILDAGLIAPRFLGDRVWDDRNGDGEQQINEPGVENVVVRAFLAGQDGDWETSDDILAATTVSDQLGGYHFSGLADGAYRLFFTPPQGFVPPLRTVDVGVAGLHELRNLDAGFYRPAEFSGRKWNDLNGDGLQDANEPGLNGWTVELRNEAGFVIATSLTADRDLDENGAIDPFTERGHYAFANLPPGIYHIGAVQRPGWSQTYPLPDETLLADDFNDNSLDGGKWFVTLPFGDSSVSEAGGRMEFRNRGYLVSQQQFNPADGELRISGRWKFENIPGFNGEDFFQLLTRSDGVPAAVGAHEARNGIEFRIDAHGVLLLFQYVDGVGVALAPQVDVEIADRDEFEFEARDDGTNLRFTVIRLRDGVTTTISGQSSQSYAVNRIAVHNREFNHGTGALGYLDDFRLTTGGIIYTVVLESGDTNTGGDFGNQALPGAAPVVDLNGAAAGTGTSALYDENSPATALAASDAFVTDLDTGYLRTLTAELIAPPDGAADELSVDTAGTTLTTTFVSGVLTIVGPASLADFQQVLRTLSYRNTSENPAAGTRTVLVRADDGLHVGSAATVTVEVTPINDAPSIQAPPQVLVLPGETELIPPLSVADVDVAPFHRLDVTLSVEHGVLEFADLGGVEILAGGVQTASVTLRGARPDLNRILANVLYTGDVGHTLGDELTVLIDDRGQFGAATALTAQVVVPIIVNQPPVVEPAEFVLAEHSPIGTLVGTVIADDPDDDLIAAWEIVGGNASGAFAINAAGQITVADTAAIDFDLNREFRLLVQATDDSENAATSLVQEIVVTIDPATLRVLSLNATPTGMRFMFSRPVVVSSGLNLYDYRNPDGQSVLGLADVRLVGAVRGEIAGSLIVAPGDAGFVFVATSGLLLADTYTVILRSGADGFRDLAGAALDGDNDNVAGGDAFATLVVADSPGAVVMSLPHFARGPDQAVNVPANATWGLPVQLSDGGQVGSLTFDLRYDAGLLNVTGVTLPANLPPGSTATLTTLAAGHARVSITFGSTLGGGDRVIAYLQANVPASAVSRYGEREVLDLTALDLRNGGGLAIAALDQDAVHVNAYYGDAGRNGRYDSFDVQQASRLAVRLDSGFQQHPLLDPRILADFNGNNRIDSFDVQRLSRLAVRLPIGEAPALPSPAPTTTDTDRVVEEKSPVSEPPKSTPMPATTPRSDLDGNGAVDAQDVLWAVYYFNRSPSAESLGESLWKKIDLNGDDQFDAADILVAVRDFNAQTMTPADDDSLVDLLAEDLASTRKRK